MQVNAIGLNPSGTLLVSGCKDGAVTIWDTDAYRTLQQVDCHAATVHRVSFSPGWLRCSYGKDSFNTLLKCTCKKTATGDESSSGFFYLDSRHVLSIGADSFMKVTDVQTGMVISSVKSDEELRCRHVVHQANMSFQSNCWLKSK